MTVTLIRHAKSTFNAYGDLTRDCPITNKGIKQASELKDKYDLVICSTLKRARQTLDFSSIVYSNLIFTDLCREIRDGLPINIFNGESDQDLYETNEQLDIRINEFKKLLILMKQKYNNIAVISHKMFMNRLCGHSFRNCEKYDFII